MLPNIVSFNGKEYYQLKRTDVIKEGDICETSKGFFVYCVFTIGKSLSLYPDEVPFYRPTN